MVLWLKTIGIRREGRAQSGEANNRYRFDNYVDERGNEAATKRRQFTFRPIWWLGSRVVSVLDSGAEGPGFKSQ